MTTATNLTVTHRFGASPERVFDAWVKPEQIAKWMAAPARAMAGIEDEILKCEADARVGGRFSFVVRREGRELDHTGAYLEVERPRRLVFTWGVAGYPGESTVALDFVPEGEGTVVTLVASGVDEAYREQTAKGWGIILEAIASTL